MQGPGLSDDVALESELIGAALRYVAIADWFETRPCSRVERARDHAAMDVFNRVEAELRRAGGRMLRRQGHREVVLEQVLRGAAR